MQDFQGAGFSTLIDFHKKIGNFLQFLTKVKILLCEKACLQ